MGMLSWIIFGALAGWVASMIMGTNQRQGCLTTVSYTHLHGGCNVLGAAPQNPFSLFFADFVGKKE